MFHTIVVGHDGSARSDDAVALALQLLDPDDGCLVLAAIVPSPGGLGHPPGFRAGAERRHSQTFAALQQLAARIPAPAVEIEVFDDPTVAAGLDLIAAARDADLLVLGSTQRGGAGRAMGRSTAQRLLHHAPCAIALAPPGHEALGSVNERILVAHDGSSGAAAAADIAFDLAAPGSGTVVLCRVIPALIQPGDLITAAQLIAGLAADTANAREELAAVAARAPEGVAVECRVVRGDPAKRLLDEAGSGVNLLVTGSRHHALPTRAVVGSVSTTLLTHCEVPMIIAPRPPVDTVSSTPDERMFTAGQG